MDFHGLMQTKQSVEQLGLELQKLAKRAFPTITGTEFDRLLKGHFFQALLPRWQRKLGAPRTEKSFDELFARARTTERREEQYSAVAGDRNDAQSKVRWRNRPPSLRRSPVSPYLVSLEDRGRVYSAELVIGLVILPNFVSLNRKRVQKHLASPRRAILMQ